MENFEDVINSIATYTHIKKFIKRRNKKEPSYKDRQMKSKKHTQ